MELKIDSFEKDVSVLCFIDGTCHNLPLDDYDITEYAQRHLAVFEYHQYQIDHIAKTLKEKMLDSERDQAIKQLAGEPGRYLAYFKDVSNLDEVDVYLVCKLFNIQDPSGCTQHAIKKLLLSGVRTGGKTKEQDIQEAVDTLNRRMEIYKPE